MKDLNKKMVILSGPRQVGKSYLANQIADKIEKSLYLNYDRSADRIIIEKEDWLADTELLVFDELHKMPGFKNYLKGIYDTKSPHQKILVTGSARLETFRQAGDSLAGRFFLHRLLPFSLSEINSQMENISLERFLERGGFPEPFLAENREDADRWRRQYTDGLVRNDILDFENIHDLRAIQIVFEILRERTGSPVSYSSIARDAGIAPNTVKKYIEIFEALYIVFRITPYSKSIARSILKEPKIYFFDTGLVKGDDSAKLENFAAVSLLKRAYEKTDLTGIENRLHYVRTKEGHEVDFITLKDEKPEQLIEVKYSDSEISPHLKKFSDQLKIPTVQIVMHLKRERVNNGIEIRRAESFLKSL